MNVYKLSADLDNYQNLYVEDTVHRYINDHFHDRVPLRDSWKPLEVSILQFKRCGVDYGALPANDFPKVGGMPVFSKRAVDSLRTILTDNGEVLPLLFEGKADIYFAFNPLRLVDALDEDRSRLRRISTGQVTAIEAYEFHPSRLNGETFFKIPQQRGRLYVTDGFLQRVVEASLTGFLFKPVWSSGMP